MLETKNSYKAGKEKEGPALEVAERFLADNVGLVLEFIEDKDTQIKHGDFLSEIGYIEVKGQPIDPIGYRYNFTEFMMDKRHCPIDLFANGFARTAAIVGLTVEQLAAAKNDRTGEALGFIHHCQASLESMQGSDLIIYANSKTKTVEVYSPKRLLRLVGEALVSRGYRHGAGGSNEHTFGVSVDHGRAWRLDGDNWIYLSGAQSEGDAFINILKGLKA